MEACRERVARNAVRDATRREIEELKRENGHLKQIVAELILRTQSVVAGHRIASNPSAA